MPGGDERSYAPQAAAAAGCAWITQQDNVDGSLEVTAGMAQSARPGVYMGCLNERQIAERALEVGANAIYTGELGDGLFFEERRYGAADFLWRHGINGRLLEVARDSARLEGSTVWKVLWDALRARFRTMEFNMIGAWANYCRLVTDHALKVAASVSDSLTSPWLRELGDIPPGKRAHIAMLTGSASSNLPLKQPGDPEYIAALACQPLMELCLRIPTYVLTSGARTRAVARHAFAQDVPSRVIQRNTKGHTGGAAAQILSNNVSFAKRMLLEGQLVQSGLLDRNELRAALSGASATVSPTEVLCHLSTEIWLRRISAT